MNAITLESLAPSPLWVTWAKRSRNGKPTKVPFNPMTEIEASASDPLTWAPRDVAERAIPRIVNGGIGGIGIEFAEIGGGLHLGGVDLDSCLDPEKGEIAGWAQAVIDRFASYTEISPSGCGVKVFFAYRTNEIAALRSAMKTQFGKRWAAPGGGDHGPGIELYLGGRYFAVTGQHLDGTPTTLETIDAPALLWLIEQAGPAMKGATAQSRPETRKAPGGISERLERAAGSSRLLRGVLDRLDGSDSYGSRSERAMALGAALKSIGWSFSDMGDAIREHPSTAEWFRDKCGDPEQRELHRIWENATPSVSLVPPELKRPLRRETPPPEPYPMAALLGLRPAVEAIRRRTQAPQALCAASVLAAAGFAAAIHHDVEIPNVGPRPLVTAFLTIAQSGERKTSVDHLASLPIRRAEAALAAQFDAEQAAYGRDKEAFDAARIEARKAAKDGRAAVERALADVGSEPKAPAPPMLTAEEGTIEGLINLLTLRPYAAIFSAEGGMFLGGHAMSEDAAVRTMTTINTLWDGSPIKRLRAGKATFAPGRRASLSLAVQRSVASILMGNASARDNGLISRMLISEPETTIGTRLLRDREPDFDEFLDEYNTRMGHLLSKAPRRLDGSDGLDPEPLPFNVEAERRLILFHDATERDLADGRRYSSIRGFGAKMVEHASRLAGILAAYAGKDVIDAETFDAGATLASWYAGEQLRLGETVAPDPELDAAQELLNWWRTQPDPRLPLTTLYKSGPNRLRKADDAKRAVAILEDHGWIERLPAGTVLDGSPRREAWGLIP